MHGSIAAKVTDESEYSGRRKTLLPRLANSKDWRQWAFKTETILKQKELWYVIENAAPAREIVALSANETARLRGQRQAQLAYETELKNQDMHSWGDQDYPCLSLPAIPETRTETDEEWQTRNLQYFTDSNAVFTEIVNCAEDEALILLQRLESGNGGTTSTLAARLIITIQISTYHGTNCHSNFKPTFWITVALTAIQISNL